MLSCITVVSLATPFAEEGVACESSVSCKPQIHANMPELKPKAFPGHAAVQLVEVAVGECAIHSVVVYQDRAEVKRSLPVHLLAGENELVLTNMAECADKNSVR